MAIDFNRSIGVRYLNRDFFALKRALFQFSTSHMSGVFQDQNESSPGVAVMDFSAYVGDILGFYLDAQYNELRDPRTLDGASSFAKTRGYRPLGKRPSRGVQTFFLEVPAVQSPAGGFVPDDTFSPTIRKGAQVGGPNGTVFETTEDVYFSASAPTFDTTLPRMVTGSRFDSTTGQPTYFAIRKDAPIVAGTTKTDSFSVVGFQQFRTIDLNDLDVIEILSVEDSDGNEWTEVDYLAQEAVFEPTVNDSSDGDVVPYVLKLRSVPRRFVSDWNPVTGKTTLIFGSGDGVQFDDQLVPNLGDLSLPLPGRATFSNYTLDPQNFLKTRSLGLSPVDTTLTVTYRVGGGDTTNVAAGSIRGVLSAQLDFSMTGIDPSKKGAVESSLETLNVAATHDGGSEESIAEIKANAAAFYASQRRAVTREDVLVHVLSLPQKFGQVAKAFVQKTPGLSPSLDAHIITLDQDGHFAQPTTSLMKNVATWLSPLRMLTDGINLLGCDIVNFRVEFGVVISPSAPDRPAVLARCLSAVRDYFDSSQTQIQQPIILSDLSSELQAIQYVVSVYQLSIRNVFGLQSDGTQYSDVRFDVDSNTLNQIVYCPNSSIFELKFPGKDIVGAAK